MRDSGCIASQWRRDRIDKLVESALAFAGNVGQKFQPTHAAPVYRGIGPAERSLQELGVFRRRDVLLPRPQINQVVSLDGVAAGIPQIGSDRATGKEARINVNLQPVALTQEGLGLVLKNGEAKTTEIVTSRCCLKIYSSKTLDRRAREALDAKATIRRSFGANDIAERETLILGVEPAMCVQVLVSEHASLLKERADVALFGLEEMS